ncbi:MAG: antitoxin [Acidimicrobiia bacterium]|jgi:hypothetical protein|nr:antitoxin [Acidimicrobiia bacterium]
MARTTLDLDDAVLRELRQRRQREGKPLGVIASELLAHALSEQTSDHPDFAWTSRSMEALVDVTDKDAVWSVLDER